MTKILHVLEEQHTAPVIIKTEDSIVGYEGSTEVFAFRGVTDFSMFTLADGATFDESPISDKDRIAELEQMINLMLMGEI